MKELEEKLAKAKRQLAAAVEQDEKDFAQAKISKIEAEIANAKKQEEKPVEKPAEKPKEQKEAPKKKAKAKNNAYRKAKEEAIKQIKQIKGRVFTEEELNECDEYFRQKQSAIRAKRIKMREKQGKPAQLTVAEKVGKVNEQVIDKLEKKAEKGDNINRDVKALFHQTSEMVKELKKVAENIDKTIIKKEVESLINELKEFWQSL